MAIRSGFFNSVDGDRRYLAQSFAEYFATFISNGVFAEPAGGLSIRESGGMNLTMRPGKAWINGYYFVNDENYQITIDASDAVLKRIDRIVLQLNFLNRVITPLVKKGTSASNPVPPDLKRDSDAYEIALADVEVKNGVSSISQFSISDLRFSKLCGIVTGVIDQIDTSDLFIQYQDEFNAWFNQMKGQLSTDAAGNLQLQINATKRALMIQEDGQVFGVTDGNLNTLIANSTFTYFSAGSSNQPLAGQSGIVLVIKRGSFIFQVAFMYPTSGGVYWRRSSDGATTWGKWNKLIDNYLETAWTQIVTTGGWTGSAGTPPMYRRNAFGQIELKGMLDAGTKNDDTTIFNLPTLARPTTSIGFIGAYNQNPHTVFLYMGNDGNMKIRGISSSNNGSIRLDGLKYDL